MKKFLFPDKVRYGVAKSIDFSYGRKSYKGKLVSFEDKVKEKIKSQKVLYGKFDLKKRNYGKSQGKFKDQIREYKDFIKAKSKSINDSSNKIIKYEQYLKVKRNMGPINEKKMKEKVISQLSQSKVNFGVVAKKLRSESRKDIASRKSKKKKYQIKEKINLKE